MTPRESPFNSHQTQSALVSETFNSSRTQPSFCQLNALNNNIRADVLNHYSAQSVVKPDQGLKVAEATSARIPASATSRS